MNAQSTIVAEATLVEGVWYAMEQAGRLLIAATREYRACDAGSAVALAMFAREELGRSRILLDLAQDVHAGAALGAKEVRRRCSNHTEKQDRGALSVVFRTSAGHPLDDALRRRFEAAFGSPEYEAAQSEIDAATTAQAMSQPANRHRDRMSGVYLDLAMDGQSWERPLDIDAAFAREVVEDAINDYANARQWFVDPLLHTTDTRLLAIVPARALIRTVVPVATLPEPPWMWTPPVDAQGIPLESN